MTFGPTRDALNHGYKWRTLSPTQALAIRDAYRAGASAHDLALAYSCSTRTIYRALLRAKDPTRVIVIEGWRAEFALTDEGPVRMTSWFPA